jgi:hypothetical protein
VAERDRAVVTLGRMPDTARGSQRAEDFAARLHRFLDGRRMTDTEAGAGLGENPNRLRYATTTGTVLIRAAGMPLPGVEGPIVVRWEA